MTQSEDDRKARERKYLDLIKQLHKKTTSSAADLDAIAVAMLVSGIGYYFESAVHSSGGYGNAAAVEEAIATAVADISRLAEGSAEGVKKAFAEYKAIKVVRQN